MLSESFLNSKIMKICIGIQNINEIKALVQAGADEFFCGFTPKEWRDKFIPEVGLNRRESSFSCSKTRTNINIGTYAELKDVIKEIHKYSKKLYINFNAHYYTASALPLLHKILNNCVKYKVDGMTIADLALLIKLKEWKIKTKIILSGEFGIRNSQDLTFINNNFEISRVIFPRHITTKDMTALISAFPQYEYEAFAMNTRCPFDGANCFAFHAGKKVRIRLCANLLNSIKELSFKKNKSSAFIKKAFDNLEKYIDRETNRNPSVFKSANRYLKPPHCGLCELPTLKKARVDVIKICGREGQLLEEKILAVRLAKEIITNNHSTKKIQAIYSACYANNRREICKSKYLCYY